MTEKNLWHVERVTAEEYERIVPDRKVFFNEPRFTEQNKEKADDIFYLILMRGESARFGVIIGRIGNNGKCPFSAPYSFPVTINNESKMESIDIGMEVLEEYCRKQGIKSLCFIFPPLFYAEHLLSGWISACYRGNYRMQSLDVNYTINLEKMNVDIKNYGQMITNKGRKSLQKAERLGLNVFKCENKDDFWEAYHIIQIGHEAKGFPVKMSFEELSETLKLVEHEAFIVRKDDVGIVAEYLYHINNEVIQGIYTGTHPDYMNCSGMNFLTYYTIRYYGGQGYKYLDKAISTENSIPNYGLCNFKESVGCERNLKFTFYKELF